MYVLKLDKEYSNIELGMTFYTYILHTRVDINLEDIYFLYQDNNELFQIELNCIQNNSFREIMNNAKIIKLEDKNIIRNSNNFICIYSENEEFEKELYNDVQIMITKKENIYFFDLKNKFSYNQKNNFEKFFIRLADKIKSDLDCKLEDISILEDAEKKEMINTYNTKSDYDANKTILDYFKAFLASKPNKECVTFKGVDYSYIDIDLESNYIANELIKLGIQPKQGVVIFMERSQHIISTILAIMKCSCYYIPVDISTPVDRLVTICEDSSPFAIITNNDTNDLVINKKIQNIKIFNVDDIDENNSEKFKDIETLYTPNKDDYCYMIYTSGTTGKPKGVAINNKNIGNFVKDNVIARSVNSIDDSAIMASNKIGFDAFIGDSLLPLAIGMRIVIASAEDLNNSSCFVQTIEESRVNVIQTTPTRLNLSILEKEPEVLKNFEVIACGGEPLLPVIINKIKLYSHAKIINLYGPTETTVWSTSACITEGDKGIGKPSSNQNCYILNRYMKIIPKYETGILYISGDGLGKYCFDELNQKIKYIHWNEINDTVYNTGDTAYIDSDDYIIFGTRADTQVKINGVRIELTEIENVALELKEIKECAAIAKDVPNLGKRLIMYYTENKPIGETEIRKYLKSKLPETYVPSFIIKFTKMPLTSSNKIDKKALPLPKITEENEKIVLPTTSIEKAIYNAFKKAKPEINIGISTNYEGIFDSLDLTCIYSELSDLGYNISLELLAHSNTIEEITKKLQNNNNNKTIDINKYPKYSFNNYSDVLDYKNILLTGATGFLGIHILENLLKNTSSNIICLVHNNKNIESIYNSYHMETPYDRNRITVIQGSLEKENFGLNYKDGKIIKDADTIINCAAYVNYFGNKSMFENSNILAVRNLADFAIKHNIILNHVSTLSVLGTTASEPINEFNLFFGQNIHYNQYIESKFMGELELQAASKRGLKYRNFRIGRLAWRIKDNQFQLNADSNEFYSSLLLFKEMHMVPSSIINTNIEISPIEYCANAICKLIHQNRINGNFHIMNDNLIQLKDVITYLNLYNSNIKVVPEGVFMRSFSNSNSKLKMRNMICISNGKYQIEANPYVKNDITRLLLEESGFKWPKIERDYFGIFK
ncbi:MAG: AMP-binding protein [Clostridia bacterium]|nr:AMP-binding protein [Clostridia bacterium]